MNFSIGAQMGSPLLPLFYVWLSLWQIAKFIVSYIETPVSHAPPEEIGREQLRDVRQGQRSCIPERLRH
jgi:hypothetical protein